MTSNALGRSPVVAHRSMVSLSRGWVSIRGLIPEYGRCPEEWSRVNAAAARPLKTLSCPVWLPMIFVERVLVDAIKPEKANVNLC